MGEEGGIWGAEQMSSCGTFPWLTKEKEEQTIYLLLTAPETLLGPSGNLAGCPEVSSESCGRT